MAKTVAVDFDGVIHTYDKGWQNGEIYGDPVLGAFDGLRKLMRDYAVFIHTTRDPYQVVQWVEAKSGIPCVLHVNQAMEFWNVQGEILVTNFKFPAIAYIDDRGIRFINWDQALTDLDRSSA